MNILNQTYTLSNGVKLPKLGLGTWQMTDEDGYRAVTHALKHGYRHIDTAAGYQNEIAVGRAVRDAGLPREAIFVTSKLESHIKTYEGAKAAIQETMDALNIGYVDLFLIHAPWPWSEMGKNCDEGNVAAWRAMEEAYHEGKFRAIGVSNFAVRDIENILAHSDTVPHVNQIAYFIGLDNNALHAYCQRMNIQIVAYSPLAIGYALSNDQIVTMAKKYRVTPAQICIRYCLQKNTAPLPKSTHAARIEENAAVDFDIDHDDMETLDSIQGDPRRWDN